MHRHGRVRAIKLLGICFWREGLEAAFGAKIYSSNIFFFLVSRSLLCQIPLGSTSTPSNNSSAPSPLSSSNSSPPTVKFSQPPSSGPKEWQNGRKPTKFRASTLKTAAPVAAAAAPVLLVTGSAAPVENPYTAPGTQVAPGAGVAGVYPAPFVKKTSFGLYLGAYIASILLLVISMFVFASAVSDIPDFEAEQRQIIAAETEEEMNAKSEAFATELDASTASGLGIGSLLGFAAWGISVFAAIYGYIILYRAWHILQPGGARTTPGAAVGFMFIPLFNLYWVFNVYVGWSTDWNRIRSTYPDLQAAPAASGGMFIAALVCLITIILFTHWLDLVLHLHQATVRRH